MASFIGGARDICSCACACMHIIYVNERVHAGATKGLHMLCTCYMHKHMSYNVVITIQLSKPEGTFLC